MNQFMSMQKNLICILLYLKINLALIRKLEQLLSRTIHLFRETLEELKKVNIIFRFGSLAEIGTILKDQAQFTTNKKWYWSIYYENR